MKIGIVITAYRHFLRKYSGYWVLEVDDKEISDVVKVLAGHFGYTAFGRPEIFYRFVQKDRQGLMLIKLLKSSKARRVDSDSVKNADLVYSFNFN